MTLKDRPPHTKKWFLRKHQRSFRNGINVASKTEIAEIPEKILVEKRLPVVASESAQIRELLFVESEMAHVVNRVASPQKTLKPLWKGFLRNEI